MSDAAARVVRDRLRVEDSIDRIARSQLCLTRAKRTLEAARVAFEGH